MDRSSRVNVRNDFPPFSFKHEGETTVRTTGPRSENSTQFLQIVVLLVMYLHILF
jgi:hypothetical protein